MNSLYKIRRVFPDCRVNASMGSKSCLPGD